NLELLHDAVLQLFGQLGVRLQEITSLFLALAELLTLIGEPGPRLLNNPGVHAEVKDRALSGNALTVEDVELGDLERRRDLILHDLQPGAVTPHILAVLQCLDAADVAANGGVELQGLTAGGRLRG